MDLCVLVINYDPTHTDTPMVIKVKIFFPFSKHYGKASVELL